MSRIGKLPIPLPAGVEVSVDGLPNVPGEGGTKREAEQRAAAAMLVREGVWKADRLNG